MLFLPDYNVTLAERLIPASDVSEQISTAGYEASGTSNMKFMMNGALTIGTRDGATIEMAAEAGEENFFLFGLTAEQVAGEPRLVQPALALRARAGDPRSARPDLLGPLQPRRAGNLRARSATRCWTHGDYYMHLADLTSYAEAQEQRRRAVRATATPGRAKAILNVAGSGRFSSDRTIAEYAAEIWGTEAVSRAVKRAIRFPLSAFRKNASSRLQASGSRSAYEGGRRGRRWVYPPAVHAARAWTGGWCMALRSRPAYYLLAVGFALAAGAATLVAQTRASSSPRAWSVERTPDGHPDFQGVWANNTVTPLQRPKQWEGKTRLTDAEIAELQKFAAHIIENDGDAQFGDGFILAVLNQHREAEARTIRAPATTTSSGWSSATGTIGGRRSSPIRPTASFRR